MEVDVLRRLNLRLSWLFNSAVCTHIQAVHTSKPDINNEHISSKTNTDGDIYYRYRHG